MVKKRTKKGIEKGGHTHLHKHEKEIHLHKHEHNGIVHVHPHFHPEETHTHPHKHDVTVPPTLAHQHEHLEAHSHIHTYAFERYAHLISPIHALDPRVKLITFIFLVILIVLTPHLYWFRFLAYFCLIFTLIFFSRLPLTFIIKRSLAILPFILIIGLFIPLSKGKISGSYNLGFLSINPKGLVIFLNILIKSWLSILVIILLSASTKFSLLLKGLEHLKIPAVFISLLSFIYRFASVIKDEILRMKRAKDSRNFGDSRSYQLKMIGQMIGSFFIRSYERSERIYQAMIARGFDETIKTIDPLSLKWSDLAFSTIFLASIIAIQLWRC